MGYVGCYDLNLYCDDPECINGFSYCSDPASYIGNTFDDCAKQARKDGWKIIKKTNPNDEPEVGSGKVFCPKHSSKKRKSNRSGLEKS